MLRLALCVAAIMAIVAVASRETTSAVEYQFIVNGTFDEDVNGWATYPGYPPATWSAVNKVAGADSGSAMVNVSPEDPHSGLYQCIPATPGVTYTQRVDVRVPLIGNGTGARAYIHRLYSANANCVFVLMNQYSSSAYPQLSGWDTLTLTHTAPAGAVSMWTFLTFEVDEGQSGFAYFDNASMTAGDNQDGDACSDGEELGPDPAFGGDRSPFDAWDFYDVTNDKMIDLADTLVILEKFGLGPLDQGYNAFYDRVAPDPQKPWRTALAPYDVAGIDLDDALVSLASFGHSCADPVIPLP